MKIARHNTRSKCLTRSLLGGLGAASLMLSCSAADDLLGDLFDHLDDGPSGGHHGPGGGGGSAPFTPCGNAPFTGDDLYAVVANDLARLDADDAQNARYLSVGNSAKAKGCGAALDNERAALNKLVNSLSTETTVSAPVPVDADLTLYRVDLRDYGWDRVVEVDGTDFADGWEAIVASSPYAVPFVGDDADDAAADSGTSIPVLFGNAFVAAASQAPLYYSLLGIPADLDDFLSQGLQIDVPSDRLNDDVVRAGFVGSGPNGSAAESLAERFEIEVRAGAAWQIFAEAGGTLGDPFSDPLGTPDGERELVFSLPNGFQGHVLADAGGQVRTASDVLLDTNENDFRAKVARSYLRRRAQGVDVQDEVREFALQNTGEFTPAELERILAIYPEQAVLEQLLARDRDVFAQALAAAGLDIDSPEPVSLAFLGFDADVDLATAAGDLMLSSEELEDNLAILDPALGVLGNGGRLDRDDFSALYLNSLCILSIVNNNQPDSLLCDAAQ